MSDELIRDKHNNNPSIGASISMPKIGSVLSYVNIPEKSPLNENATREKQSPAKQTHDKQLNERKFKDKKTSMENNINHYIGNFQPQNPLSEQQPKNRSPLFYIAISVVCLLLLANLFIGLQNNKTSFNLLQNSSNPNDNASLEFETVVPLSTIDNETEQQIDNIPNSVQPYVVNVPKRRVLVISEETRKELLQQLNTTETNSAAPAPQPEHIYEYYRK